MTAVAALDIGGTHVSAARVEPANGEVERLLRVEYVPQADRQVLLDAIAGAATTVCTPAVESIGVSAPGPFDYANGVCRIRGLGKLESLYGVDLRRELARACGVRSESVRFLNDAEAFALGEARFGAARGHARVIGLTLGTGLGSAFLVDGEIVRDGAGVPPDGSLHLLAFRGAPVEERISGRSLQARTGREVRELAATAPDELEAFAADLATFLEPWIAGFAPTCIVVGGSISRSWHLIGPTLAAAFPQIVVVPAERLEEAALLGAALSTPGSP